MMPQAMLDNLKPEYVTPGVMNLVKEDAPTGMILSAGAGAFLYGADRRDQWRFCRAQGDALTAEAVAAKWDEITDTSCPNPLRFRRRPWRKHLCALCRKRLKRLKTASKAELIPSKPATPYGLAGFFFLN